MDVERSRGTPLRRASARGVEAGETAFALLDGLWHAPVGIAFLDRGLRLVQVNEAFAKLAGLPATALAGRTLRDLFGGDDAVAAATEQRGRAVVASGQPALDVGATSRAADGARRTWRASLYPVLAPGGEVRGVCAVVDETTHVRDRELELDRARTEAIEGARRLALLGGLAAGLSAAMEPAEVAAVVLERLRSAVDADAVAIRTLEAEGLVPLAAEGLPPGDPWSGRAIPLDAPLPPADALAGEQGIWLESLEALEARYPHLAARARADGLGASATFPLRARGRTLGALEVRFREARSFDLEGRALLLTIAEQCAQALDRARLFASAREALAASRAAADRLTALQTVTAALSHARTPRDVAEVVVESTWRVVGADVVSAYFLDPGGATISLRAHRGLADDQRARYGAFRLDAPFPASTAARTGAAAWLESWRDITAAFPGLREGDPAPWSAAAAAALPLRAGGAALGAITFWFHRSHRFDPDVRRFLESIADQCAQALDRALLFEAERAHRAAAERDRAVLDGIFENAPLGIGLYDSAFRFVRVNPVLAAWNGAAVEAHPGRSMPELLPDLAWEELQAVLREVLATGAPRLDVPVSLRDAEGRRRHFVEAWYPVRVGGEPAGLGAIIREVTAERDADEFQRNVLGIVGHDVRSPLAAVATAAHLLGRGEALTERQARLVERIRAGATRIEQVVSVLLDYARARREHGLPVRRRPCDLAALCRGLAEECEGAHPGRTVRCDGEVETWGEWDPDRLGQAIANLVSNALDYSPPESVVHLSWRSVGGEVAVRVANAGAPIPPETLARLFEPFRRGRRERADGLGLGLFIARAIVVAHGGIIDVRSDASGTAFTVRLPCE